MADLQPPDKITVKKKNEIVSQIFNLINLPLHLPRLYHSKFISACEFPVSDKKFFMDSVNVLRSPNRFHKRSRSNDENPRNHHGEKTNNSNAAKPPFPSTTAFLPTNFTILAHHAWHTLTLGLGTKKSKVLVFVFESETMKGAAERLWPSEIPLGEVNKKFIRGQTGCEMARFKFRKGCITFYVYAVRRIGTVGFSFADDLRTILQSVAALKDFLDHTAMLAMPNQRSINYGPPVAMVH